MSVNISHSVFSVLFSPDDLAMQVSVVCVSCYEFTHSSCVVQYNIQQCFIAVYFLLYFVLSVVALE